MDIKFISCLYLNELCVDYVVVQCAAVSSFPDNDVDGDTVAVAQYTICVEGEVTQGSGIFKYHRHRRSLKSSVHQPVEGDVT